MIGLALDLSVLAITTGGSPFHAAPARTRFRAYGEPKETKCASPRLRLYHIPDGHSTAKTKHPLSSAPDCTGRTARSATICSIARSNNVLDEILLSFHCQTPAPRPLLTTRVDFLPLFTCENAVTGDLT